MPTRVCAAVLFIWMSMVAAPPLAAQAIPGVTLPPQAAKAQDPLNRSTPQSAMFSFLDACRSKQFGRAMRYLDLSKLPEQQRVEQGRLLAEDLGRVLDGYADFDMGSLSRESEGDREDGLPPNRERVGVFTVAGQAHQLQLDRSELRPGLPVWRFAPESVEVIPKLAQGTSPSWIERHLPAVLLRWTPLNTPAWKWIALGLLAVALATAAKLTRRGIHWLTRCIIERTAPGAALSVVDAMVAPLQLLIAAGLFRAGMEWIGPSAVLRFYLGRALGLLSVFAVGWLCVRILDIGIGRFRGRFQEKHLTFSRSVLPLASRVTKILIVLLAITAVLSNWGYNTTTILAGLGIGGVAIALASQKTIENLFGGVAVITDRPVNVGDFCKFGDNLGTVEDIGLRSTRIRTLDRTLLTVPNAEFSSLTLENFSQRDKVWFHPKLNLRRDTEPDQVREILESIDRILREHPKVETGGFPVRFVGVGDYSLDIEIFAYVLTADGDEFLRIQQDLLLRILDAVTDAGTALALPTQVSVNCDPPSAGGQQPQPNGAARAIL